MRNRTRSRPLASLAAGALVLLAAVPVGAGAPLTVTLAPSPGVVGDSITVVPDQPCPDPTDGMMVEVLVDTPDGSDLILDTTADGAGAWSLDFTADQVGDYEVIASCIYLEGNVVYQAASVTITEQSTTTTTTTDTTIGTTAPPTIDPLPPVCVCGPPADPQPEPPTFTG